MHCDLGYQHLTTNVFYRVFRVELVSRGSAFTLDVDGRQYIVTAKHVLGEAEVPASISILYEKWESVPVRLVGMGSGEEDVLVLATNQQLSPDYPVDIGSGGIVLGQPVRFLGFMPKAPTIAIPGTRARPTPLAMGGVFSGIHRVANQEILLWVDGQANPGFSGGPVIYQPISAPSREACRWKIAGVIAGYVIARIDVVTPAGKSVPAFAESNSGLLVATSIETVQEIIEANPIGFKLPQSNH